METFFYLIKFKHENKFIKEIIESDSDIACTYTSSIDKAKKWFDETSIKHIIFKLTFNIDDIDELEYIIKKGDFSFKENTNDVETKRKYIKKPKVVKEEIKPEINIESIITEIKNEVKKSIKEDNDLLIIDEPEISLEEPLKVEEPIKVEEIKPIEEDKEIIINSIPTEEIIIKSKNKSNKNKKELNNKLLKKEIKKEEIKKDIPKVKKRKPVIKKPDIVKNYLVKEEVKTEEKKPEIKDSILTKIVKTFSKKISKIKDDLKYYY